RPRPTISRAKRSFAMCCSRSSPTSGSLPLKSSARYRFSSLPTPLPQLQGSRCQSTAVGPRTDIRGAPSNTSANSTVEIAMSMPKAMVQRAVEAFRSKSQGQVVLVLQGGGALGAYQVGVYEALHEAGVEPDWIIGTSIGAINASIIAGNKPQDRLAKLKEFWSRMERPSIWPLAPA